MRFSGKYRSKKRDFLVVGGEKLLNRLEKMGHELLGRPVVQEGETIRKTNRCKSKRGVNPRVSLGSGGVFLGLSPRKRSQITGIDRRPTNREGRNKKEYPSYGKISHRARKTPRRKNKRHEKKTSSRWEHVGVKVKEELTRRGYTWKGNCTPAGINPKSNVHTIWKKECSCSRTSDLSTEGKRGGLHKFSKDLGSRGVSSCIRLVNTENG